MRPGEIYLAAFPFGDVPGMKLRPVLLLTSNIGVVPEVLVAYISSVIPSQFLPSDLVLDPAPNLKEIVLSLGGEFVQRFAQRPRSRSQSALRLSISAFDSCAEKNSPRSN